MWSVLLPPKLLFRRIPLCVNILILHVLPCKQIIINLRRYSGKHQILLALVILNWIISIFFHLFIGLKVLPTFILPFLLENIIYRLIFVNRFLRYFSLVTLFFYRFLRALFLLQSVRVVQSLLGWLIVKGLLLPPISFLKLFVLLIPILNWLLRRFYRLRNRQHRVRPQHISFTLLFEINLTAWKEVGMLESRRYIHVRDRCCLR